MKKQIATFLSFALIMLCMNASGQFTSDVNLNTQVSASTQDVTGIFSATTPSGKTYIAYLDGYFKLKLQLLDANGYKNFPAAGITLDSASTTWSMAGTTDIKIDEQENAIIAFANWEQDSVKVFVVSPTGSILAQEICGSGHKPVLETLADQGFVLAFSTNDSTTSVQKFFFSAGSLSHSWTSVVTYSVQELKALPDGNFYIISYAFAPSAGYAYTYVNLIAGDVGNKIWSNWACCSSLMNSSLYTSPVSCSIDGNQGIYVSNTYFDSFSTRRAYAQHICVNGNIMWGADGKLLCNNATFLYQYRIKTLFNDLTNELLCLVDGDNGIYFQKISCNGNLSLPPSGIQLPGIAVPAQLFGAAFSNGDIIFAWLSETNMNIYASKIDIGGNYLWNPQALALNTTSNGKTWVDASLGDIVNDQIVIVFQETRHAVSRAFAQNANSNGTFPSNIEDHGNDASEINIYPNPNNGDFIIETTPGKKYTEIMIAGLDGQLVLKKALSAIDPMINLSFDGPSGMYFITLKDQDGMQKVMKMIKE